MSITWYFSHHSRWQANQPWVPLGEEKKEEVIHYPWIFEQRIINFLVS